MSWDEIGEKLRAPLPDDRIEWRVGQSGKKQDGTFWCKILAYMDNRAVQERLDAVVGAENWKNEYADGPGGGVICGISIWDAEKTQWICKWDGAENTDIESVKGGLSDSMKRAAVQWGIGRHLYDTPETWADTSTTKKTGWNYAKDKKSGANFYWQVPGASQMPASNEPPAVALKDKVFALIGSAGDMDQVEMLCKKYKQDAITGGWSSELGSLFEARKAEFGA